MKKLSVIIGLATLICLPAFSKVINPEPVPLSYYYYYDPAEYDEAYITWEFVVGDNYETLYWNLNPKRTYYCYINNHFTGETIVNQAHAVKNFQVNPQTGALLFGSFEIKTK